MDGVQPRVRVERVAYAPETVPCPQCGAKGRGKDVHTRRVRARRECRQPIVQRVVSRQFRMLFPGKTAFGTVRIVSDSRAGYVFSAAKSLLRLSLASPNNIMHFGS
jgi:hypothetical protein